MKTLIEWLNQRINEDQKKLSQINKNSPASDIIFCSMTTLQSVLDFINNNEEEK